MTRNQKLFPKCDSKKTECALMFFPLFFFTSLFTYIMNEVYHQSPLHSSFIIPVKTVISDHGNQVIEAYRMCRSQPQNTIHHCRIRKTVPRY